MSKYETVVGAIISAELVGAFQTPDGKWSFTQPDNRRFRTADADVVIPDEVASLGWREGKSVLVTLTSNTAGRIMKVEVNGNG